MEGRHNSRQHKLHKRMRAFRNHYIAIGEECKERSDRNENILYAIESTVTKATRLAAKTQRMRELKKQHAEYCQQSTSLPTVSAIANEVSPDMKRTYISSAKLETPINYPINRTPYANISPHLQNVGLRSKNDMDYFNEQMQRYSNQVFKKNAKTMTDDDKEIENKSGYKISNSDLQHEDQEFVKRPNYPLEDVKSMDDDPIYKKEQPVKYLYPAEKMYEIEPPDGNKATTQRAISQNLEVLPYRSVEYKTDQPIHADMAHLHIEERPISSGIDENVTSYVKSSASQNEKVTKINKDYTNNYEDQENSKIEEVLGEKIHPDVTFESSSYSSDMVPNKFFHEPSQFVTEPNVTKYTGNQHPKGIALKIVEIKPTSKLTHFEKTANGSPKRFEYISNYEQNKPAPVTIIKNNNDNSMPKDKMPQEKKIPSQNDMIANVKSSNEQQMNPKSNFNLVHQTTEKNMLGQGGNEEMHVTNIENNRYQNEYLTGDQHHINEMSQNANFSTYAENENQMNSQNVNNQDPSFGSQQDQTWYNNESQQFSYNSGNIDDSNQYNEQNQSFQEQNQGFQEQSQSFQDQNQSFQEESSSFQDQNQSFKEQAQSFQEPNQSFQEQNQSFEEPNQGFQGQNEDSSGVQVQDQTEPQQIYSDGYDQYTSQQNTYFTEGSQNQDQGGYYENQNLSGNIQEENQYQEQFNEGTNQYSTQQDPNLEGYHENPNENPHKTESPIQNTERNIPQTNEDNLNYNNDSVLPAENFSVMPENQNMDHNQTNYQDTQVYNTDNSQVQNQISFQEGHDGNNQYFEQSDNNVPYSQDMNPPVQNQTENMLGENDNEYQQNHNEYPQTNTTDAHNQNLLAQSSEVVSPDHELNTQNIENHALGSQDSQQYMQQVPESEYYPGDQTMYSNDQGEYYEQYQQDPNLYAGDPNYSQDPQQYQDNTQYAPDTNNYEDGYMYSAEEAENPADVQPSAE